MSEPGNVIVYSSDAEWVISANQAIRDFPLHPMYVFSTQDYGPGAALWNIDGKYVLVYQDLSVTLAQTTGLGGRHDLHDYVDLFLVKTESLQEMLWEHGYHWDYQWLTEETAAPPLRKKESS